MSGSALLLMHAAIIVAFFAAFIVVGTLTIYFRERLSAHRRCKGADTKIGPYPGSVRPIPTRLPAKSAPNRDRREPSAAALPVSF